jgi:Flp pilus assembly protein TadD
VTLARFVDADSAERLFAAGRYEDAAAAYTQLIERAPADPTLHIRRASAWAALGRADDALADLDEAVALNPRLATAYHERGALLLGLGRDVDALRDLDRAVRLAPTAAAYADRASALFRLSRDEEARRDYARALELDPELPAVHFNLGVLEARRGDFREAVPHLLRAARLGFEPAVAALEQARQELFVAANEDGTMELAIDAFLDARSEAELEEALERFPFMALTEFLEVVERLVPMHLGPESKEAARQRVDLLRALAATS